MSDRWFTFWKVAFWIVVYAALIAGLAMICSAAYLWINRR